MNSDKKSITLPLTKYESAIIALFIVGILSTYSISFGLKHWYDDNGIFFLYGMFGDVCAAVFSIIIGGRILNKRFDFKFKQRKYT